MTRIEHTLSIQNKIQEMRLKKGLTQQELADALSITRATVVALERGSYNPSLELAFRLSHFFKLSIDNLFKAKGPDL